MSTKDPFDKAADEARSITEKSFDFIDRFFWVGYPVAFGLGVIAALWLG